MDDIKETVFDIWEFIKMADLDKELEGKYCISNNTTNGSFSNNKIKNGNILATILRNEELYVFIMFGLLDDEIYPADTSKKVILSVKDKNDNVTLFNSIMAADQGYIISGVKDVALLDTLITINSELSFVFEYGEVKYQFTINNKKFEQRLLQKHRVLSED